MKVVKSQVLYIPSTESDNVDESNTFVQSSPKTPSVKKISELNAEPLSNLTPDQQEQQSSSTTAKTPVRVSQIVKKRNPAQGRIYGKKRTEKATAASAAARMRRKQAEQVKMDSVLHERHVKPIKQQQLDLVVVNPASDPPNETTHNRLESSPPQTPPTLPSPTPATPTTIATSTDPVRAVLAAIEDESARRLQMIDDDTEAAEIKAILEIKRRYRRERESLKAAVARDLFDGVKMFLQANKN